MDALRTTIGKVRFKADCFDCTVCGLHLEDEAELAAAGPALRWLVPGADPNDYDPGPMRTSFRRPCATTAANGRTRRSTRRKTGSVGSGIDGAVRQFRLDRVRFARWGLSAWRRVDRGV